jgi:hypothetical protein
MDNGRIEGRQVFPAAAVALSHRLIATHTNDSAHRFAYFDREGWGAGWDLGTYEGERMVSRFGGYHSFRSHVSFLAPALRRRGDAQRRIGLVLDTRDPAFAYDRPVGHSHAIVPSSASPS